MFDRLSPLDASFLYLEGPSTPMHVGTVMVLRPPAAGLPLDRLAELVAARIGGSSRYRQRVREVAGRLAAPVWVDDAAFDLGYHVRRAALPRPGNREQLAEFTARIQARPLDRRHPLWEVYLVEGLEHGRVAVVTKSHPALVDAVHAVDIGHLILDPSPAAAEPIPQAWTPRPEPHDTRLVAEAALGVLSRPGKVRAAAGGLGGLTESGRRAAGRARDLLVTLARTASLAPTSPLNAQVGRARRMVLLRHDLADHRLVRDRAAAGGPVEVTVNDVVLATLTGGLRSWLQNRGEPVHMGSCVRALVPLSVARDGAGTAGIAGEVVAAVCDLPVGEPAPSMRLRRIAFQMARQASTSGGAVGASTLAGLAGFAPPTLHHLGVRLGGAMSRRLFNLVVTNVPGPQRPLYASGARMEASYPVIPLAPGHALSVGVTSYDGSLFLGLNGDRQAMGDLDLFGECVDAALAEMIAEAGP